MNANPNPNQKLQAFLSEQFAAIREVIALLQDNLDKMEWEHSHLTATGTYLGNIYQGVESCLKMVLEAEGCRLVKNDRWHQALLETALEKELIPDGDYKTVRSMLAFRHFFVHGYASTLREHDVRCDAPGAIRTFSSIEAFLMVRCGVTEQNIGEAKERRRAERREFS